MIYIVRHGETDWNAEKRIQGRQPNIPLNANGRKQAQKLAQKIAGFHIDVCLCSPLQRAVETAKILHGGKIIIDERLAERSYGILEGRISSEISVKTGAWNMKMPLPVPFETVHEIMARVKSFLDDIKKQYADKNVLVVTHGGVVRCFRAHLDGIPDSGDLYDLPSTKNCEVLVYKLEGKLRK